MRSGSPRQVRSGLLHGFLPPEQLLCRLSHATEPHAGQWSDETFPLAASDSPSPGLQVEPLIPPSIGGTSLLSFPPRVVPSDGVWRTERFRLGLKPGRRSAWGSGMNCLLHFPSTGLKMMVIELTQEMLLGATFIICQGCGE